jgi:Ni,Fe-hydrogenase maturation factor
VLEFLHQNETAFLPGAVLIDANTDLLNFLEDFAGYDRILLIDTILDPENKLGSSGQIAVLKESEFLSWSESSSSVHHMSPLLAVKLFRQLYPDANTQITLIGLLVDQLTHVPRYATADRIREATNVLRTALA